MTSHQRDDLAKMAEGVIKTYPNGIKAYEFQSGPIPCYDWHPETSFDDCQPLFAKIERRVLWIEFRTNLIKVWLQTDRSPREDWRLTLRTLYYRIQPADIVAAFKVTIEEADES